jgi:hypothetical protein
VGVQVRCDRGGTEPADVYTSKLFYGKGNENHELGTGFFVRIRIISVGKIADFVRETMSHITLRDQWYNIIVLNVHAPTEDKLYDIDSFYEERECVFDKFPKEHTKILLRDINVEAGRKDIFQIKSWG